MNTKVFLAGLLVGSITTLGGLYAVTHHQVQADERGERITKEKNLEYFFDETNPEGNVDLKQIVEEELHTPAECEEAMVICQIKSVGFDITIKKEWLKLNLSELNNQEFANTVPRIEESVDELEKPDVVVLQETLARRGLLTHLDGSVVYDRGFFGALTWLGLLRLGHVKGLSDEDPEFNQKLTEQVNELLNNMADNTDYVSEKPLPNQDELTPSEGDDLYELWKYYSYLAQLAQNADRVDPGNIPLQLGEDVNIDGYVNVERVDP